MADRKTWSEFRTFMIAEYEQMLRKGAGTTVSQEGWGGAFNATSTKEDDDSSLLDSITRYAERATAAKGEVSALKSQMGEMQAQLAAMMMGPPQCFPAPQQYQQPPQMAMFGPSIPPTNPPTINVPQQPANKKRKSPNQGATQQPWTQ